MNVSERQKSIQAGFTLIELLVVIAIIGLLSSVVLASLSSARAKARVAAIAGNLRNMIPAVEMAYDSTGNYSTACTVATTSLDAIKGTSIATSCLSYNDGFLRWGASAITYAVTPPIKAWSVSQAGQVAWDAKGVDLSGTFVLDTDTYMNWNNANAACTTAGGRLPTLEELYTLAQATRIASGNATTTPPGFVASLYWPSTVVPSNNTLGYKVDMSTGFIGSFPKSDNGYVRCVR
jgi:prepilin-type N-terminal cleavage/methylation domain-containing protein